LSVDDSDNEVCRMVVCRRTEQRAGARTSIKSWLPLRVCSFFKRTAEHAYYKKSLTLELTVSRRMESLATMFGSALGVVGV
jgi:hypothetical protein